MCIKKSVGNGGANESSDVKTIQLLLNINIAKLAPITRLVVDGGIGQKTIAAIEAFQSQVMGLTRPDGRVDPDGGTLAGLRAGLTGGLSADALQGIMIHAAAAHIDKYAQPLADEMARNRIDTPLRQAHFLAQVGHESGELRYSEEIASGEAYEGRKDLGNTQPGDGKRFKGRGLIQLTGRTNYTHYGEARGKDYTTDATAKLLATDPVVAVDVSCWFWTTRDLNGFADKDDILTITKRINGGTNGLDDRKEKLVRAKFFLKV
ncbi:putative chitinase [Methylomagnum ishizawai]|uniref:Putative chitinase n=1 Tax=Methylomagnum ishizawai TaxID=1760988 RepID=A0A1Y6D2Z7_9GAMM|nr:glycoside hydrolase family 19 protein [Methylomagnum ishizawai]SMF95233.1 putative chitinase [Methylomagnum ishizawai]